MVKSAWFSRYAQKWLSICSVLSHALVNFLLFATVSLQTVAQSLYCMQELFPQRCPLTCYARVPTFTWCRSISGVHSCIGVSSLAKDAIEIQRPCSYRQSSWEGDARSMFSILGQPSLFWQLKWWALISKVHPQIWDFIEEVIESWSLQFLRMDALQLILSFSAL